MARVIVDDRELYNYEDDRWWDYHEDTLPPEIYVAWGMAVDEDYDYCN